MSDERREREAEERRYNTALDELTTGIRDAVFAAYRAGVSPETIESESESALIDAIDDAPKQ